MVWPRFLWLGPGRLVNNPTLDSGTVLVYTLSCGRRNERIENTGLTRQAEQSIIYVQSVKGNAERIAKVSTQVFSTFGDLKMAEKAVNYTPEQTAQVVADYTAGVPVEQIAEALGKSVRSIVAKLSREGVYQKKQYATKTGEPVQKKDSVADAIGAVLLLTEAETDSLAKANKTALVKIFAALANSKPV